MPTPLELLRYHVTGAIERGEADAIVETPVVCESCGQRGLLEILPCSGGAVGDIYVCRGCDYQHRQQCEDCKAIRLATN